MNIKVGDYIHVSGLGIARVWKVRNHYFANEPVYEVKKANGNQFTVYKGENPVKCPINNKLNRLLYPTYIEKGEYLVPNK